MATPQPKPAASKKPAAKKTTVKSTLLASTVPQSYSWAQAGLLYEQKAAIGIWTPLEPVPGKEGYPVSLVVGGEIVISQANEEATCTCKFEREFGFSFVGGSHAGKDDVTISVAVLKAPEFSFGGQQPELAKQFPLAKALVSVNGLQLKIPPGKRCISTGPRSRIPWNMPKELVQHMRVILTRREPPHVKHPSHLLLNKDKDSLRLDSILQEKQLGLSKNCSIKTHPGKYHRCVVVEIFPGKVDQETAETKDFDFGSQKLGQSYVLEAPTLFPKDEETMKNHPILGQPGTLSWEIDIVEDTQGYNAPVVGIIRNTFPDGDLDSFIGEEKDVSLRPVFSNVLGSRGVADWEARAAMARNEKEEEATMRLEAFEQDVARRREALRAQLDVLEQNVARARDALKAQLGAEKEFLESELAMEKAELEVGKQMEEYTGV